MALSEPDRRKVWVLAGGRCTLCKAYLMEGNLTHLEVSLGELAHVVGQQETPGSPRGDHPLPVEERDEPENILLACSKCHTEIDKAKVARTLDVEKLREVKRSHESLIKHLTGLSHEKRTLVLRMLGQVRGNAVEVHQETAAKTVIDSGDRFPHFELSYHRRGIEIDLRTVAGEAEAGPAYYQAAMATIDEALVRLKEGVSRDQVAHISVFAFARLPLLIYLGSKLDDTVPVEVYQRVRTPEGWDWAKDGPIVFFQLAPVQVAGPDDSEIVLLANISGTIQGNELPPELADLPRYCLQPREVTPEPDTIRRRESLQNFTDSVRSFLSQIEAEMKSVKKIHLLGALPLSAAVSIGRVHAAYVHPTLIIYDRTKDAYVPRLEIA